MSAVGALVRRDPLMDDGVYEARTMPLPRRPQLARYRHTCPDGTRVRVSAQYVPTAQAMLYRWLVGEVSSTTSVAGRVGGPPSYAVVDALHGVATVVVAVEPDRGVPVDPADPWRSVPVPAEPECGCGGRCMWCDPFANVAAVPATAVA